MHTLRGLFSTLLEAVLTKQHSKTLKVALLGQCSPRQFLGLYFILCRLRACWFWIFSVMLFVWLVFLFWVLFIFVDSLVWFFVVLLFWVCLFVFVFPLLESTEDKIIPKCNLVNSPGEKKKKIGTCHSKFKAHYRVTDLSSL